MNSTCSQPSEPVSDQDVLHQLAVLLKTRPVWLRVGQLFDGMSDGIVQNADIVFDAHKILSVSTAKENVDRREWLGEQVVPDAVLPNFTALPCLVEAHAHLFLEGGTLQFDRRKEYLKQTPEQFLRHAKKRLPKILQHGIGTIRDAGDKHGVGLALAVDAKTRQGSLSKNALGR